jgi:hypothetical protein
MRILLFILIALLIACANPIPKDYVTHNIDLKNNIGRLSISLPNELDTSYSWQDYSDTRCSDKEKHRFSNKNYSKYKESGFFKSIEYDSIYQVTISQDMAPDCDDINKKVDNEFLDLLIELNMVADPSTKLDQKKIIEINNRNYVIITTRSKSDLDEYYMSINTIIKSQRVSIHFNCLAGDCGNFINRMKKSINTIKITDYNNL